MAGVNVGSAYVTLMPSMQGFAGKVSQGFGAEGLKAGKSFGKGLSSGSGAASGFSSRLSAMTGVVAGFAGAIATQSIGAIASLGGEMVAASDSAQKFASTMSFAGVDSSTIDSLTKSTQEYADKTVYDLADIRNVTAQLASNGVKDYAQLAEASGNLNAVAGGNADTFRSVSMVMTQTAGAGKLTTENWNQLADAIPGASGKLQEAMLQNGAYTGNFRDAMEKGEITADEFNQAIMQLGMTDVAQQAATSTTTIEGALGNLQAAFVNVGSQAIDAIKPALTGGMTAIADFVSGIPAALGQVGAALAPAMTALQTAFAPVAAMVSTQLLPALAPLGAALGNLASAVLPVINAWITAFAPVLAALVERVIVFATAIATSVTPVINNLAALVQAALPMITAAWTLMANTIQAVITAAFPVIEAVISTAMSVINSVISIVLAAIQGDWSGVWSGIQSLASAIWSGIQSIIGAGISFVQSVISAGLGLIQGVWDAAWGAVSSLFSAIWEGIKGAASAGVDTVVSVVTGIKDRIVGFFAGAGQWLVDAGRSILEGLQNGIMGAIGSVTSAVSGAVGRIRDLFPFSPAKAGPFSGHGYTTYSGRALMSDWGRSIAKAAPTAVRSAASAMDGVQAALSRDVSMGLSMTPMGGMRAAAAMGGTGSPQVILNGAVLNDDAAMRAAARSLLVELARKGVM